MTLGTMYPGKINSPETSLAVLLTDSAADTTVVVIDSSVLPDAPNIMVVGTGEDAETIYYPSAPVGHAYAGCTRGFQGDIKYWAAGTPVARLFTAYDYDTLRTNIGEVVDKNILTAAGDIITSSASATPVVVPIGAEGQVLTVAGTGLPEWSSIAGTVTEVTGTSPIVSSGGTAPAISILDATVSDSGAMSAADKTKLDGIEDAADVTDATNVTAAGAIMDTTYATKGDIIVADDDETPVALAVGTDGQVLTAQADGTVAWEDPTTEGGAVASISAGDASITIVGTTTPTIAVSDAGVTLAKMADLAQDKIIGRSTASTGVPEVITCTAAGRALLDDADASAQRTTLGISVTATLPITATATTTPVIAINAATTSTAGSMSAADKIKINSLGYSAIVYQDATTTYAVSKAGVVLHSHLISAQTDGHVIQAAIDAVTVGTVLVAYGTYYIETLVTVNANVSLQFEHNTVVKPATDIDMFQMKRNSQIKGCKILVTDISYSHNCITLSGSDYFGIGTTYAEARIEDIWFRGTSTTTGTAIYMHATDATLGFIRGVSVDNIVIYYFLYGIRLYTSIGSNVNYINGNSFSNIWSGGTQRLIYATGSTSAASDNIASNKFYNLDAQPLGTTTVPLISITGQYNIFIGVMLWDWSASYGDAFVFESDSNNNFALVIGTTATYLVNNGDSTNTIITTRAPDATTSIRGFMSAADKTILEKAFRTTNNILKYGSGFDNAEWVKANCTVTANSTTAPDGSNTALKMVETAATGQHRLSSTVTIPTTDTYVFSVYAKAAERTYIDLRLGDSSGCKFDLTTGVCSSDTYGKIIDVGSGWWRCSYYKACTAGWVLRINVDETYTANESYLGDITKGVYLWGAQCELGSVVTGYNPTESQPYITEKGGVSDVIANGATITHGLGVTPAWAIATSSDTTGDIVAVSAVSSTTLTISILKRSDGTAGTSKAIYWRCGV